MKGLLFDDFFVEVDLGVMRAGGSWARNPPPHIQRRGFLRFLYEELKKLENPVVLDIGASTGSLCLLAAFHEMKVHAFEPNPETRKILEQNIMLNNLEDKITTYHWALSNVDEEAYLKIPIDGDPAWSTLGRPRRLFREYRKVRVQVRRLDDLNLGHVDIAKIDTQGNEYYVLLGAEEMIRKYKPKLFLEYSSNNTTQFGYEREEILELLKSWGYSYFQLHGKRGYSLWVEWNERAEEMI